MKSNDERYEIKENVLYLNAPNGIGRSKLVAKLEKVLGMTVTMRNLRTIHKVKDLI